jgi:hypothetical protein
VFLSWNFLCSSLIAAWGAHSRPKHAKRIQCCANVAIAHYTGCKAGPSAVQHVHPRSQPVAHNHTWHSMQSRLTYNHSAPPAAATCCSLNSFSKYHHQLLAVHGKRVQGTVTGGWQATARQDRVRVAPATTCGA